MTGRFYKAGSCKKECREGSGRLIESSMKMHETAVAESILQTILKHADETGAKPTGAIISCGQFNALNDECMQFAFEAAAAGTPCEGMTLTIKHIPLQATCKGCKTTFEFDIYKPACSECESGEFEFEPDAPLLLETIEFEDETQ